MKWTYVFVLLSLLMVIGVTTGVDIPAAKDYYESPLAVDMAKIKSTAETASFVLFDNRDIDSDNFYKYDKTTGDVEVVSKNKQGIPGNKLSDHYTTSNVTHDITFHSWATNLGYTVTGCNIYQKQEGRDVVMIQQNARFPALSSNGKYLAFEYYGDIHKELPRLYVRDLKTQKDTFVAYTTLGNTYGWSTQEFTVGDDGSVIFQSTADNLIPNDYNKEADVFIYKDGKISLYGGKA